MAPFRDAFIALTFLTRIPIFTVKNTTDKDLFPRSFVYFPVVGIILGSASALLAIGLSEILPNVTVAFLVVAFLAWVTRGLHLDGLADWADALGGGYTPKKRLEIMKDSRIGSFGVIALVIILSLKGISIFYLISEKDWFPVICAPMLGRFAMVGLAVRMPSVGSSTGLGNLFVSEFRMSYFLMALLWCVPLVVYRFFLAVVFFIVTAILILFLRRSYKKNFGGITGDLFGTTCEIVECAVLCMGTINIENIGMGL